jgi:hypothetical protein
MADMEGRAMRSWLAAIIFVAATGVAHGGKHEEPPILGAKPAHCATKLSHYYQGKDWPDKGYGWAAHSARKWGGYGPWGTGAYRGFGYGFNAYPVPFRAYKFGYPENVLGPGNVGNGYIYYTYFREGYPGWKWWPGRHGQHW